MDGGTRTPVSGPPDADGPVLVTGASGYIGGRLVPRLLERGYRVRCLARSPRKLGSRPWAGEPGVELVAGDAGFRRRTWPRRCAGAGRPTT